MFEPFGECSSCIGAWLCAYGIFIAVSGDFCFPPVMEFVPVGPLCLCLRISLIRYREHHPTNFSLAVRARSQTTLHFIWAVVKIWNLAGSTYYGEMAGCSPSKRNHRES